MPTKVILTVTEGKLRGGKYSFEGRTTSFIGRDQECYPKLPDDKDHQDIGRRHCLLDVNPPDIRVRDLGSLNGTYVNEQKIGQRAKYQSPEEGAQLNFLEYDLKEGDKIQLGNTVFRVSIFVPTCCEKCGREIPEERKAQALRAPNIYECDECRQKERIRHTKLLAKKARICAKCGRDVSAEVGKYRQGDFVCADCKANPLRLIKFILDLAESGDENLLAIQGYEILKELGRGGMGAVYLARHTRTGKPVALKVMLPEVAANEYAKESFLREAENTKALRHTHVVELRDWGFSSGTFFFTLEYCDSGSVEQLIAQRGGRLPTDEAIQIIFQALEGLDYAHHAEIPYVKLADGTIGRGHGLVHRDIKPANLFLSGSGQSRITKVGDYGLAKAFDMAGLAGLTRTGTKAGSPWFMPRQQVENFKYVQPEVDIWAMAASFYYMLTGQCPRSFPKDKDPWSVARESKPVPICQRGISVPKRLAEVIDQALVDDPAIYFKTATELKRAIERVL